MFGLPICFFFLLLLVFYVLLSIEFIFRLFETCIGRVIDLYLCTCECSHYWHITDAPFDFQSLWHIAAIIFYFYPLIWLNFLLSSRRQSKEWCTQSFATEKTNCVYVFILARFLSKPLIRLCIVLFFGCNPFQLNVKLEIFCQHVHFPHVFLALLFAFDFQFALWIIRKLTV